MASLLVNHPILDRPDEQIRVLIYERVPGDSNILTFRWRIISPSDKDRAPFCAVSYAWSAEGDPKTIDIDGRAFPVSETVWTFLMTLPLLVDVESNAIGLFIDAICINQNDPTEKGHQVRLMRSIYQSADLVICWLGIDTREDMKTHLRTLVSLPVDRWNLIAFEAQDTELQALEHLACNRVWTRLWIAQELVLPQSSKLVLMYGDLEIPWAFVDVVSRGLALIRLNMTQTSARLPAFELTTLKSGFGTAAEDYFGDPLDGTAADAYFWNPLDRWSLLFDSLPQHGCSLPLDRIYGVLGILKFDMVVDYDISLVELYRRVVRLMVDELFAKIEEAHSVRPGGYLVVSGSVPTFACNLAKYMGVSPESSLELRDGRSVTVAEILNGDDMKVTLALKEVCGASWNDQLLREI